MTHRKSLKRPDMATAARLMSDPRNTNAQIRQYLGCAPRTVTNLRKRIGVPTEDGDVEYGPIDPTKRGPKPKLNNQEDRAFRERLINLITENPQVTKDDMKRELGVSGYKLNQLIKDARISHKRAVQQPNVRNSPELINERHEFAQGVIELPDESLVFLDETGFNLHTQRGLWLGPNWSGSNYSS